MGKRTLLLFTSACILSVLGNLFAQTGGEANVSGGADRVEELTVGADERNAAADIFETKGKEALAEAEKNEARIRGIAKEITRFEASISDSRERLVDLARREADATDNLHLRRRRHAAAFSAIIALSKAQAPAIIAHDGDAAIAARSATVLKGLREALIREARDTSKRTTEIHELRHRTELARIEAKDAIASLRAREKELWTLVGKRRGESRDHLERAGKLKQEAEVLDARARALDAAVFRAPAPPLKPLRQTSALKTAPVTKRRPPTVADAVGNLVSPVIGEIAARYDGSVRGSNSMGLVYESKPYARVYSPWDGKISFSGAVRRFGLVTIIDIGEGYQILLAGLASSVRVKGDEVLRGEPIGHLGGPVTESEEFLVEQSALPEDAVTSLYFQIRRDGKPIDPTPWLE